MPLRATLDEPADELAVDILTPPARRASCASHGSRRDDGHEAGASAPVNWVGVQRLFVATAGELPAASRAVLLVLNGREVVAGAPFTSSDAERDRSRSELPAGGLASAAQLRVAVNRAEQVGAAATPPVAGKRHLGWWLS